ncbi:hypothetical protein [Mesorhizobium sp. M0715]|uniref:hypothetical protein n=1 Tax=Mesorhizobium sp. M0715 TaxID=2956990 RepID=UPI003334DBB7
MEGPEPLYRVEERNSAIGVIALEILVMQVMLKAARIDCRIFGDRDFLKASVVLRRSQGGLIDKEQHMHGMRGDNYMHQDAGEVSQMLDRVHRQAGPGPGFTLL